MVGLVALVLHFSYTRPKWEGPTAGRSGPAGAAFPSPLSLTVIASMPEQLPLKTALFDSRFPNQVRIQLTWNICTDTRAEPDSLLVR